MDSTIRYDQASSNRLCPRLLIQPIDFDFVFQGLEFCVAGDQFGFAFFGQGGGEGVGQADPVAGFDICGHVRQCPVGGMKFLRRSQNYPGQTFRK